jgi:hypothetical protein
MSEAAEYTVRADEQYERTAREGNKLHRLKGTAMDVFVPVALLMSIAGVALFDLWALQKLWHAVFG